jgi:SRSO17 transposase
MHREVTAGTDWGGELDRVWQQLRPRFARAEMRVRSRRYLLGLLGGAARKNGWHLAEAAGERSPHGMQDLLGRAVWDADAVRDDLRAYVVEHLGDPEAVLVVDETGFRKKGTKSVGVQRQYSGTAGRIENCQIGVFLAYASPRGRAFLDRALYVPQAWTADTARREEAGIPQEVSFATKGDLAQAMLARAFAAEAPAAWVTGDAVYGNDGGLRHWLEHQEQAYVLAVACSHPVWQAGVPVRADALVEHIPCADWARIEVGAGSKGPRVYDWACGRLPYETADGWAQWLLIRRSVAKPEEGAFYRVFAPEETTVPEMARVAGTRWAIETCFEEAKGEVGLADYEVRCWDGWHRHVTLALLAHAMLAVTRAGVVKGGTTIR